MFHKIITRLTSKTSKTPVKALPKGFKAASPIKNKKLLTLLTGPDITVSGGTHTVVDGRPLLGTHAVHN